jgi:hypothetical protein
VCVRVPENEINSDLVFGLVDPVQEDVGVVPTVMIHLGPLTFVTAKAKKRPK